MPAALRQQVQAFIDAHLSPQARAARLAEIARKGVADLVADGKAPSTYQTIVDGRLNAVEESVRGDGGGSITYLFDAQANAAIFAIGYLRQRAPKLTGRYIESIWIGVNGSFSRAGSFDPSRVPAGATITLVDTVPYARKIEVGHMHMKVPHKVVEDASRATRRQFATVAIAFGYVNAPESIGGGYVLQGHFRKGVRGSARTSLRSDTSRDAALTYPSITFSRK